MPDLRTTLNNYMNDQNYAYNLFIGVDQSAKQRNCNIYAKTLSDGLQGDTDDLLAPMCPMAVRHLFIAQHHAKVNAVPGTLGNSDEGIRMKTFMVAIFHFPFTLLARIIRVVLRTVFSPFSLALAAYQNSHYQTPHSLVIEDLKSIGYEWIDFGSTLCTPFVGLINTAAPQAIPMDQLRDYYIARVDDVRAKDKAFREARDVYFAKKREQHVQWTAAQSQAYRARA